MRADAHDTRALLIATAERLFAERGVDAVTLLDIGREAGQRNRNAAQYHFENKSGFIRAIFEKHSPGIAAARSAMLDALEAKGRAPTLLEIAEALVHPVAAKLDDPDGGQAYILLNAQLIGHPTIDVMRERFDTLAEGADRLVRLAAAAADVPRNRRKTRSILARTLLFHGLADYIRDGVDTVPRKTFVDGLVESIAAVLQGYDASATRPRSVATSDRRARR